jgi:hypothetical protein
MAPVSALWHAIVEVKQRWSVIGWVTKNLLSRAPLCFGRHVKPSAAFVVLSTHQPALGQRGGPFSLCVIDKNAYVRLCPSIEDINRLMTMMMNCCSLK